jgi:hypothetical protein
VYIGDKNEFRTSDTISIGAALEVRRHPTWIINESDKPLDIIEVAYGDALGWPRTTLQPGQRAATSSIDYIGPNDTPPQTITVTSASESTARFHTGETRTWLTWD